MRNILKELEQLKGNNFVEVDVDEDVKVISVTFMTHAYFAPMDKVYRISGYPEEETEELCYQMLDWNCKHENNQDAYLFEWDSNEWRYRK